MKIMTGTTVYIHKKEKLSTPVMILYLSIIRTRTVDLIDLYPGQ